MDFTLPYADDNISFMRKALIFIIAVALPLVGLCTSVYWDRGELSTLGYDDWEDTRNTCGLFTWATGMAVGSPRT